MHINTVGVTCDIKFDHSQPFNESATKIIEDKTAIVSSDAAVKNREMGGCWIASDANDEI